MSEYINIIYFVINYSAARWKMNFIETFFEKNGAFLLTLFGVPGGLYAAGNIFGF